MPINVSGPFPDFMDLMAIDERNIYVGLYRNEEAFKFYRRLAAVVKVPTDTNESHRNSELYYYLYHYFVCYLNNSVIALLRGHYDQSLSSARIALDAIFILYMCHIEPEYIQKYKSGELRRFTHILNRKRLLYPLAKDLLVFHGHCSSRGSHADWSAVKARAYSVESVGQKTEYRMAFSDLPPTHEDFKFKFVEIIGVFAKATRILLLTFNVTKTDNYNALQSGLFVPADPMQEWAIEIERLVSDSEQFLSN